MTLVRLLATSGILLVVMPGQTAEGQGSRQILEATGVDGGLIVHFGCGDGKLTAALYRNNRYLVHGLESDADNVEKAREHIRSLGLYGNVCVEQWGDEYLPYADNLVNLFVAEDLGGVPMTEVMRVLVPSGVAYIKKDGRWTKLVKPWPKEMDEWTHYLHDATGNAVARDLLVGPPKHMQWVAKPFYCRSHEIDSSVSALVSARGRIFYILDEGLTGITDERLPAQWFLVARDAFNGVLLWKRPIPHWGWREWKRAELEGKDWTTLRGHRTRSPIVLPRRLVAEGDRVYVTLGYEAPVTALDAATGQGVRTYRETYGADEIVCSQGVLVVRVRKSLTTESSQGTDTVAPESLLGIKASTGEILWHRPAETVLPLSLTVGDDRVFFHDAGAIICLNLWTGERLWRAPMQIGKQGLWNVTHTLVVHNGAVLFLGPRKLEVLSARTGKTLWTGEGATGAGVANPPDLFVADGLLWYGKQTIGLDPATGEVKRQIDLQNLISPGHHFRCYRSKATERYLLWPKRGVEFIDLKATNPMRHDWLRAPCRLGFMPCNGLLYMPPHQCFCYPGVKISGFNALAAQRFCPPESLKRSSRLERGPAYGRIGKWESAAGDSGDWPAYRHDATRSGSARCAVSASLDRVWQIELGGKLTQPVVTDGRLLVAAVDAHRIWCLDASDGKPLWSYTAGGRVDSPPTVHKGLVLFGSADGWVYCLLASDGGLVWRFRAAPDERRVVAFGQVESAWPAHGSVLVKDDVAYVTAGRSSYLDGGIYLYGLDPRTGKNLHEGRLEGPYPDPAEDVGRPFDMDGTLSDVLVTDGTYLYMQQVVLDGGLAEREAPRVTNMGDRNVGRHVFSTAGFLNDSWWNRTFWMYSERWPGYYIANQSAKAGQLLVFDDTTTYGVKAYTRRNVHSPMFFPGKEGYLLFADDNDNEPILVENAVNKDKGPGFTRALPPKWSAWVPVRIRAMVIARQALVVAGPPDTLDPDDPMASFEGRKGALLWVVSAADGEKLAEYSLDSPPVFDGMIAANERLYISTESGRLLCMGKQESK